MLIMDLFYNAFLFVGSKQHKEQLIYRDGGDKENKRKLKKKNPPENPDLAGYSNKSKQPI